jgi:hypothetical protein
MNFGSLIPLLPKLFPLLPRIEKGVDTIKRIEADPDVQDLLSLAKELASILETAKPQ